MLFIEANSESGDGGTQTPTLCDKQPKNSGVVEHSHGGLHGFGEKVGSCMSSWKDAPLAFQGHMAAETGRRYQ